jgi:hypothetical protein
MTERCRGRQRRRVVMPDVALELSESPATQAPFGFVLTSQVRGRNVALSVSLGDMVLFTGVDAADNPAAAENFINVFADLLAEALGWLAYQR